MFNFNCWNVIIFFLSLLYLNSANAGWYDHDPVPVQQTSASKTNHNDRGIRRIVRINGTTICLADGVNNNGSHEGVYRSFNNGVNWTLIADKDYCNRGTIITGPNEMVYIFWISKEVNPGIYLSKFNYLETPPPASPIYQGYVRSVGAGGGYQDISAAVDSSGTIYFCAHYAPTDGEVDRIWLLKSYDGGNTWTNPQVVAYEAGTSFAYPSLEVDHDGDLILCFAEHAEVYLGGRSDINKRIYFMKSANEGETWGPRIQVDRPAGPFGVINPCILEDQQNNLYIFAQRHLVNFGLVMAKSFDGGSTWSGFNTIIPTSMYADPSAAIAQDGKIYVTYRDDLLCGDTSPEIWRNCMAQSTDGGNTWSMVDNYCGEADVGPAGSVHYANWWNYGGPIEWCWEQYLSSNRNLRPVYYDINSEVLIWDRINHTPVTRSDIERNINNYKNNPDSLNKSKVLNSIKKYLNGK